MTAYHRSPTGSNKITPCVIVNQVRHIRPVHWLLPLIAAILLFSVTLPISFWIHLISIIRSHRLLVSMLLLFCLIAISLVWTAGQRIDAYVFTFFNKRGRKPRWLDRTMRTITEFGNGIVTFAIALALFFFVNHHLAYEFILGTLIMWLIVELIKVLIRRARPFTKLAGVRVVGTRARGKSFPSGHTSQAFYMATIFIQYFHASLLAAALLYTAALLVGVTRMYMGMHYPRDVLAGAILGTCWGLMGATMNNYLV